MSSFLDDMARFSAQRVAQALRRESSAALERRAREAAPPEPLRLSQRGFDVIAELKLKSPAAGSLGDPGQNLAARVSAYARGGAAAVSVLTEPSRFDGSLEHLRQASEVLRPLGVPAMRKDFLVDPYQVLEARAEGAGGVLVILRMLSRAQVGQLLDAAGEHGMFVLLEAFDAADLSVAREILAARAAASAAAIGTANAAERNAANAAAGATASAAARGGHDEAILIGINCRDLATLQVVPERFEALAPLLRSGEPAVAESGVASAADARRMRGLGYRLALIGTALMTCDDPSQLLRDLLAGARSLSPVRDGGDLNG